MSRIAETFSQLRAEGRAALMPYLMIGYPECDSVLDLVPAMEEAGADMFELGIPFSDPLADGVTIQRASQQALQNGMTFAGCIDTVAQLRSRGVRAPLLLMGYYNPLLRYGVAHACADLADAGGDGLIVPDVPLEEASELCQYTTKYGISLILFVTPTTPDDRVAHIAARASGFLYCVSLTGVTGSRQTITTGLDDFVHRVRRHTTLPLVVGFGISTAEHVAQVGAVADGVIVGSALINHIERQHPDQRVQQAAAFVRELRK